MSLTAEQSHLTTYFIVDIAIPLVVQHALVIDASATAVLGPGWRVEIQARANRYRTSVEKVITEEQETKVARDGLHDLMGRLPTWRRAMESYARLASGRTQERLLRAAGRGLGSPRTPKAQKDFWLEVEQRVGVEKQAFLDLGTPAALLALPTEMLTVLEAQTREVARERAEDSQTIGEMRELRALVDQDFRVIAQALAAAKATAEVLSDKAALDAALALDAHLAAALAEAKVQTRKRVDKGDAPPVLVGDDVAEPGDVEPA